MNKLSEQHQLLKIILGLETEPVGVFLLTEGSDPGLFRQWERLSHHRYCQVLMQARSGKSVVLEAEELACPAAARAFGMRELPEGLAGGKALVGFGIVEKPETGKRMFETMPRLDPGLIKSIAAAPLRECPAVPDVVVVEAEPEQLMWLLLADLNLAGGERRTGNTAVLQATCVDSTIIPFLENKINYSLGCYGCRDATDIGTNETIVGFPGSLLEPLAGVLGFLSEKAIPRSRAKGAYRNLTERKNEKEEGK
jgi:uncharacterized protein (DUF169 family)